MRLLRSTGALALALAVPATVAQVQLPKLEEMASMFLSASGVQEALQNADAADAVSAQGSQSEVWSAFLNAASKNLEGGSLQKYAQSFDDLKDGDASGIFNTAVPGEDASGNSIATLNLGVNMNKQLNAIGKSATMALGLTPDEINRENLGDPSWWAKALLSGIKGGEGGMQVDCAWTASASYQTANLFFPDAQSVYHVMFFPQFGPSDMAMIEGELPDARYFSVQSYDDTFSPITSLRDFEIEPSIGLNHYAKKSASQLRGGRYKIFLTKDGNRGLPNELPMSNGNYSQSALGAIIFRLYGVDPLADTKKPELKTWGYKDPPTISLKSSGSINPTSFDQGWSKLNQCPPENVDIANQAVTTAVDSRIAEVSFTGDAVSCKIENVQDGFMLMSRERSSQSRSPFINADGSYLLACANARKNYIKNNDLIGVVRSYFPSTPYSKYQARFVGAPETYELRYASLSVYDLKPPGPVLRTFADAEIRDFYYAKYGAEKWEEQYGRNVSLILTTNDEALTRCKVDTSDSLTMNLEGLAEDGVSHPEWFGVIYRELIPQGLVINETNAAKYGMKPEDIYKKSVNDARAAMCPPGQACDSNPYRAASIMKERFPRVQWYTCSPNGVLKVADPVMAVQYDTRYDSKAVAPRAQQFFYQYCPDANANEVLVKVMAPSTTTVHANKQKPGTAPANTLLAYPVKVSTQDPVFVVGVSVKAKDENDAYFKGQIEACGYTFITDSKWTCSKQPPADDDWLTADFDDSHWERATWISDDYEVPEISPESKYITVAEPSTEAIYCRLVVPNPTYMA